jgi:hypothetical protein
MVMSIVIPDPLWPRYPSPIINDEVEAVQYAEAMSALDHVKEVEVFRSYSYGLPKEAR